MPKLFLATPAFGNAITSRYLVSAINTENWFRDHGIAHAWQTVADSLITRARAILMAQMMAAPANFTHLLFIDADIGWRPETIGRLLSSGHDVCCAVYPKKTDPLDRLKWPFRLKDPERVRTCSRTGFIEISDAPTGFLMISRKAFEQMQVAYPERQCQISDRLRSPELLRHSYHFFDSFVDEGVLQSEDYGFCRLWTRLGGEIWADPEATLDHVGEHVWTGSIGSLFEDIDQQGVAA